jgi:hypothetical protein
LNLAWQFSAVKVMNPLPSRPAIVGSASLLPTPRDVPEGIEIQAGRGLVKEMTAGRLAAIP